MARISLKDFAALVGNLRLVSEDINSLKSKYKDDQFKGVNKPAE